MNSGMVLVEVHGGSSFQYGDDLGVCHICLMSGTPFEISDGYEGSNV